MTDEDTFTDFFTRPEAVVAPPATCEGCATRGGLYIASCLRCTARMLARTPKVLLQKSRIWRTLTDAQKATVIEEREQDTRKGEA